MRIAAIILAAGESVRMGEPKALARYGAETFLHTIVRNLKTAAVHEIVIVLGHDAQTVAAVLHLLPEQYVINTSYRSGQFSSFQTGVRQVAEGTQGVFLCLVDQPQIPATVLQQVKTTFLSRPGSIVIPTFRGKRGHPPIFPRRLFSEIIGAPTGITAKTLMEKHADTIVEVEVDDEAILWNLNTKADLARARRHFLLKQTD